MSCSGICHFVANIPCKIDPGKSRPNFELGAAHKVSSGPSLNEVGQKCMAKAILEGKRIHEQILLLFFFFLRLNEIT